MRDSKLNNLISILLIVNLVLPPQLLWASDSSSSETTEEDTGNIIVFNEAAFFKEHLFVAFDIIIKVLGDTSINTQVSSERQLSLIQKSPGLFFEEYINKIERELEEQKHDGARKKFLESYLRNVREKRRDLEQYQESLNTLFAQSIDNPSENTDVSKQLQQIGHLRLVSKAWSNLIDNLVPSFKEAANLIEYGVSAKDRSRVNSHSRRDIGTYTVCLMADLAMMTIGGFDVAYGSSSGTLATRTWDWQEQAERFYPELAEHLSDENLRARVTYAWYFVSGTAELVGPGVMLYLAYLDHLPKKLLIRNIVLFSLLTLGAMIVNLEFGYDDDSESVTYLRDLINLGPSNQTQFDQFIASIRNSADFYDQLSDWEDLDRSLWVTMGGKGFLVNLLATFYLALWLS